MQPRVPVNLASEPFEKTRRVLAGTIAAGVLMIALLGLLIALSLMERGQADEANRTIAKLDAEMKTLSQQEAGLEAILRRPENAAVLERSLFLNSLLYAKGISWTRMFDDLEKVMPHNVRLMQIRPQVTSENNILLDMTVGAEDEPQIISLLQRLEASPQFGGATPHQRMPPSQSEPLLRYRISVNYQQKLQPAAAEAMPGGRS